ncbi:nucleotide sugar dehydrogenase [Anaerocolumna xylanovorans]|uniref:UDP-N-acetyl-D-galactosamine dehydrogenase n=1 Tax=Anaerocolumna xylanovorans DSM 12503 TaxID=1121345 RepID=A0A1M7YMR8_9FIRM|nr:nucleotide sugar dehydrogenase [Anaerocolumna xylanovorans]SHO53953.1 UDP-N-acetyl-D-galactosamine dehydrogenase [Anaerocolumna xylanovorans DSM 12503]
MNNLMEKINDLSIEVAVVGLGYVGMPIAVAFSKKIHTIGYDINHKKIESYLRGEDPTGEVGEEELKNCPVDFTSKEEKLKEADFIIVSVPTPVNDDKIPDLTPVISACEIIGRNLLKGRIVVFESTVYPGVTEEICVPVLERFSGLFCGKDFKVGYSPERINPGDKEHRLRNIVKIVSGMDEETTEIVGRVYEMIIDAGVFKTSSIKVAEAAKLVENAQRDINIAFMNEIAMAFERMGIHTGEVLDAMSTKWNALKFAPGLVGGHCIGVDPYYFISRAERLGYHSQIIAAGRKINDGMGSFIADVAVKKLIQADKLIKNVKICVMGITFKENCPDIRNTKVMDIINRLLEYQADVSVNDPLADGQEVSTEYHIELVDMDKVREADCLIFAVAHDEYRNLTIDGLDAMFKKASNDKKVIIDVKGLYNKQELSDRGYTYWSL